MSILLFICTLTCYFSIIEAATPPISVDERSTDDIGKSCQNTRCGSIRAANWNVAAINNNPFEYWIHYDNAHYNDMMTTIQNIIVEPEAHDVFVNTIFTDDMFASLKGHFQKQGWDVEKVEQEWISNYRERRIISQFLKDKLLGKKRLASMPDRTTNTINTDTGPVYRPSVINCYDTSISSIEAWWDQWQKFIFETSVTLNKVSTPVVDLLVPIKKSKYPAISDAEAAISLPLSTLCAAIFDAILVHIVNIAAPGGVWEDVRTSICERLNLRKTNRTLEILETPAYSAMDIIFLEEVASSFIQAAEARSEFNSIFHVLRPARLAKRDQNSMILIRKDRFDVKSSNEYTELVENFLSDDAPVVVGDIFATIVHESEDFGNMCGHKPSEFFLVSFHGDTNGLATLPVLNAVHSAHESLSQQKLSSADLIFGLDANVYEACVGGKTLCAAGNGKYQGVVEFVRAYKELGYKSCWGEQADAPGAAQNFHNRTTFTVRTYLQPQLNKAAKNSELHLKGDVNPKDFILLGDKFDVQFVGKDNTGDGPGYYIEDMVFPTLAFPSDHGILTMEAQLV